jgi:hypothetical protein
MKAKLITDGKNNYSLLDYNNELIGTTMESMITNQKLSKQNCDEIFGVVDVEKLAEEYAGTAHDIIDEPYQNGLFYGFMAGSKKTMELNEDKVFTLSDMKRAFNCGRDLESIDRFEEWRTFTNFIDSLQPTEIDVEIEMICPHPEDAYRCGLQYGCGDDGCYHPNKVPYLDSEGCLILKPIV